MVTQMSLSLIKQNLILSLNMSISRCITSINIKLGFFVRARVWPNHDLLCFHSNFPLKSSENNAFPYSVYHELDYRHELTGILFLRPSQIFVETIEQPSEELNRISLLF